MTNPSEPEQPKQNIYWSNATPEDFENADFHTWVEGVGIVSTQYEKDFIQRFGKALGQNHYPPKMPSDEDVLPEWIDNAVATCKESWRCPIYEHLCDIHLQKLGKPLCFMRGEWGRDWKCTERNCRRSDKCKIRSEKLNHKSPDTPSKQRIADAIKELEAAKNSHSVFETGALIDIAIDLLRENQP